jgi:hypothetical protein
MMCLFFNGMWQKVIGQWMRMWGEYYGAIRLT